MGQSCRHRSSELVVPSGDGDRDAERSWRNSAHVRKRWQRARGWRDRIVGARQCDRGSHDESHVFLDPVREDRGAGLDLENSKAGAPARITQRKRDRSLYAVVRFGEERLQIERELFQPGSDAVTDLVVDARDAVRERKPRVIGGDVHLDGLKLHDVLGPDDGLRVDLHHQRELDRAEWKGDDRAHLRLEHEPTLRQGHVDWTPIPRVVSVGAEEWKRTLARSRRGVFQRGGQRGLRHGDVGHDTCWLWVGDRGSQRETGPGRVHRTETGARANEARRRQRSNQCCERRS
jgi:hypothetical protein